MEQIEKIAIVTKDVYSAHFEKTKIASAGDVFDVICYGFADGVKRVTLKREFGNIVSLPIEVVEIKVKVNHKKLEKKIEVEENVIFDYSRGVPINRLCNRYGLKKHRIYKILKTEKILN